MIDREVHGTYSCSQVCTLDNGKPCDPCKAAGAKYMADYRKAHPDRYQKEKDKQAKRSKALSILGRRHYEELQEIIGGL